MASVVPRPHDLPEPAPKRQKLTPEPFNHTVHTAKNDLMNAMSEAQATAHSVIISQREREEEAGILCFVNESNPGFSGILKQRYTDFIVNEVTLDGKVVHLTDINVPKRKAGPMPTRRTPSPIAETFIKEEGVILPQSETAVTGPSENVSRTDAEEAGPNAQETTSFTLSDHDTALLELYFGSKVQKAIFKLYEKVLQHPQAKAGSLGSVTSDPITDRQLRGKLHQDIRRIFNSRFETTTGANDVITISVAPKNQPQGRVGLSGSGRDSGRNQKSKGRLGWQELGGEYLHFSLYKENKDTMEVISYISSQLRTTPRQFSFAGTKDRRGVTVQRVSVYRVYAETLAGINRTLRGSKVGNFKYEMQRLELGDLMGNEFLITLRDCTFGSSEATYGEEKVALADKVIGAALKNMQTHGFINYYGLQRFGTYSVGTDVIGKKILQGKFEDAVNAILAYSDDALACALDSNFVPADGKLLPRDDIARAEALHLFKITGESQTALEKLPRKFSGESSIVRYLSRNKKDFVGAILQIPRNLRLMYVHAYQSLVWNMAASRRWARYGNKVIKGDLVIIDSKATKHIDNLGETEVDESGEIIVLPSAGDVSVSHDDLWERARPLTNEEAASGKYSIFDIVLPTPGYDIEYPDNDIGDYYKEFMTSEKGGGLDPGNMRRAQHDFSLSGSYRKLLAQIGNDVTYEVRTYIDDNEQMVETDLEKITKSRINFGTREHNNQRRGAGEDDGPQGSRQNYKTWGAGHRNGQSLHSDANLAQRDAWKNLPAQLAKEEKEQADQFDAQRAAESDLPKAEMAQPAYKETYIQTSAEHGKRTGHRETTIMPGVEGDAPKNSEDGGDAAIPNAMEKDNEATETAQQPIQKLLITPIESLDNDLEHEPTITNRPARNVPAIEINGNEKPCQDMGHGAISKTQEGTAEEASGNNPKIGLEQQRPQEARKKIAVILKFQLGSSQYATMALRELMKQGGVQTYKPEFGSGR